jgi:hypothetical protein
MKEQVPDYVSIVKTSSEPWNDPQFPADGTSIQWTGTPFTKNEYVAFTNTKWSRLNDLCEKCTMFGTDDYLSDIA